MPAIKQNREQQRALEEVSKAIDELSAINSVSSEGWHGTVSVVFNTEGKKGKGGVTKVQFGKPTSKESTAIMRLVKGYAARVGKEALAKAQKFDILLEASEKAILKGETPDFIEGPEERGILSVDPVESPKACEEPNKEASAPPLETVEGLNAINLKEGGEEPLVSDSNVWGANAAECDGSQVEDDADFARVLSSFQNH